MPAIDRFLPKFDFYESHSRQINVTPEKAYESLQTLDFAQSPLIRFLFLIRGLRSVKFSDTRKIFTTLAEDPPREIVLGLIGRPWKIMGDLQTIPADQFIAFHEPNYVKMVWDFRFEPNTQGTLVSTETRIQAMDEASNRKFGWYWFFVHSFSGLVRKEMLRLIAKGAEAKS